MDFQHIANFGQKLLQLFFGFGWEGAELEQLLVIQPLRFGQPDNSIVGIILLLADDVTRELVVAEVGI